MIQHRRLAVAVIIAGVLAPAWRAGAADPPAPPRPPVTRTDDTVDTLHGMTIADPYRWLEDQKAPDTRAWIDAENAYTNAVIGPLPGKERIERRLTELIKIDIISPPVLRGGRYFFTGIKSG